MAQVTVPSTPIVCRTVVRIRQLRSYENPNDIFGWRQGPSTEDGFWMLTRGRKTTYGDAQTWAVRVVIDPTVRVIGLHYRDLDDALYGRQDRWPAEDDYLRSLDVVRALPADELTALRDAVLAGQYGGADDGGPRKRTRRNATRKPRPEKDA